MYRVETDEWVQQQVDHLPAAALASYAELRTLLEVKPWAGLPVHKDYPDRPLRTLTFGQEQGLVTYLILEDQRRVDVVQVAWIGP